MKVLSVLWLVALSICILGVAATKDGLRYHYYYKTCPQAEKVIANMMEDIVMKDGRVPPRLIRMHFHDCFVRGCDGSILINSTPDNKAEKDAPPNNPSVQGFDVIDKIKEVLEHECPGVVSCADILTFATRESVHLSGKFPRYDVRGGRKDGRISRELEALINLPPPSSDVKTLIKSFASKGLSLEDMVTLSGAHSIGVSHCSSIFGRHVNFMNTGKPDPTLDFHLASTLRKECRNPNDIVVMDRFTPATLDNKYYTGLLQNKGLFTSDQTLLTDKITRKEVIENVHRPSVWENKFISAMINMGEIEVLTGKQGEIRKKCGFVNY
ncbi:Plant peroxidase [Macleaya cordata]|uniref:Peroxidase n=1 Tax=Macleaya cordata TaxID=56857 RepID=A0A200Q6Z9_MACCD|nr:Plant peroxidase [Macleaya cordata]